MNIPSIIIALDFTDAKPALALAERLRGQPCKVKVGKALFTHAGPDLVRQLIEMGLDVFLDLKYHDIPNTVGQACEAAAALGVWMLNVHASGGMAMLSAAREAADKASHSPLVIGVTLLTSLADEDSGADWYDGKFNRQRTAPGETKPTGRSGRCSLFSTRSRHAKTRIG